MAAPGFCVAHSGRLPKCLHVETARQLELHVETRQAKLAQARLAIAK